MKYFVVLFLYTLFVCIALETASAEICPLDTLKVLCKNNSYVLKPELRTFVSDRQLIDGMAKVFAMSDGSQMTISPAEREAECLLNPTGTFCTTGYGGVGLSMESAKYMSKLFRWLNIDLITKNQTQIVVDISEVHLSQQTSCCFSEDMF